MRIRIITKLSELDSIGTAWTQLEHHAMVPMQHFIWARACASSFVRKDELYIVVVEEEDGTIAAIAPLVLKQGSHFALLGMAELNEPMDVLIRNKAGAMVLAKALMNMGIPLFLERVPYYSPFTQVLRNAFRRRTVTVCRPSHGWSWAVLGPSYEVPENRLNAKHRADFRKKTHLAESIGNVSYEIATPTSETLSPLLEEAFAVEAASWKGAMGTALSMDPIRGLFHRRYAEEACRRGILRLCFLRINGKTAAMQFGMVWRNRFWLLKIGYDPQFAACSPGMLLLRETMREAALAKMETFEILGAIDPRTRVWAPHEKACNVVRAYPFAVRGVAAFAEDLARFAWHKVSAVG